jgi:RNA polymerase-associated protein CTR9
MTEYTQRAYKIDKDFPLSCATFANYFLLTQRYSTVEPLARKAIEQTDVNAIASDGWYLLARKEHNLGEVQKASDYYNRADQARGGTCFPRTATKGVARTHPWILQRPLRASSIIVSP